MTDRNTDRTSASTTTASSSTAPVVPPPAAHVASDSRRSSGVPHDTRRHDRRHSSRQQSPEKLSASVDPYASPMPLSPVTANVIRISYSNENDPEEEELGSKALRILIYLSGPCFFISLLTLLYTFVALFLSLVIGPFHSCKIGGELTNFLGPATRMHLRLVLSADPTTNIKTSSMTFVLLFAPLAAAGVALASWTAAVFWFYVSILGNPDGKDRYNDGRATVLAVRAWWEKWLLRSFEEDRPQMVERRSHHGHGR